MDTQPIAFIDWDNAFVAARRTVGVVRGTCLQNRVRPMKAHDGASDASGIIVLGGPDAALSELIDIERTIEKIEM